MDKREVDAIYCILLRPRPFLFSALCRELSRSRVAQRMDCFGPGEA